MTDDLDHLHTFVRSLFGTRPDTQPDTPAEQDDTPGSGDAMRDYVRHLFNPHNDD